jgi:hypothetical protein
MTASESTSLDPHERSLSSHNEGGEASNELALRPRIALDRRRRFVGELAFIKDELQVALQEIHSFIEYLEELLDGKVTPTKDVSDLQQSLRIARGKLTELDDEWYKIEEFLQFESPREGE